MPGLILNHHDSMLDGAEGAAEAELEEPEGHGFVVAHQRVELDVDLAERAVRGRVELKILPEHGDLSTLRIDARQCAIPRDGVTVNGYRASFTYDDPYDALQIPKGFAFDASDWEKQKQRIAPVVAGHVAKGTLVITLPRQVMVVEVDPYSILADRAVTDQAATAAVQDPTDLSGSQSLVNAKRSIAEQTAKYQPLIVSVSFVTKNFRNGVYFVGLDEDDLRYPHVYTRHDWNTGTACCIFPCVDDPDMRCSWDISIKCGRTLGDALRKQPSNSSTKHGSELVAGRAVTNGHSDHTTHEIPLSDAEKLLEMVVVCSGEQLDEVVDTQDSSKKIVTHRLRRAVAPGHIGFAIGPFEQVDLAEFRDEDDQRISQDQAIPIAGYCLPGRGQELRHTCSPATAALDHLLFAFASFPFPDMKFVFVEDLATDTVHTASLALCSTRLLYGTAMLDLEQDVTRKLAHAVASQWIGVSVVPGTPRDRWVIVGLSHYMTDLFVKALCGNNELAFRIKTDMERLADLDVNRPSLLSLGSLLQHGTFEYELLVLKAPLVLHILDRRIQKAQASITIQRVISKLIVNANTSDGSESVITTDSFKRLTERITKYRDTDNFWANWIQGAGLPRMTCSQKYNKKKTCIEFIFQQVQAKRDPVDHVLEKRHFWRDSIEHALDVEVMKPQHVFKGSMTIRIHGADGTPYDHLIDVSRDAGKVEIPYNTKYRRLKRSRRAKERANAGAAAGSDAPDDVLIYCLGDVLQTQHDIVEWQLTEWSEQHEQEMEQEAYEWLRADADHEWLGRRDLEGMPPYMYISQLQQDKDVVAHYESLKYLRQQQPHQRVATFLIRTLMDRRYFYGVRKMAADCLKQQTGDDFVDRGRFHLERAFHELYCFPGTKTPRPNNFSNRQAYLLESSFPQAMARMRGQDGKCPRAAREFILDMLRFNDNSDNEFSDDFKVANLLTCLTESLLPVGSDVQENGLFDDEDEDPRWNEFRDTILAELDRFQRIDEWDLSFQNIFTVTVLECKRRLMKGKVTPVDPLEFARYMHDATADDVRIKAFEALADLGYLRQPAFSTLLVNVMGTDPSPYVRSKLFDVFTMGLATVAFGEHQPKDVAANMDVEGLVIEKDDVLQAGLDQKAFETARKTNIEDAVEALKKELGDDLLLKAAIWDAVNSPIITAGEQSNFLGTCVLLYEPSDHFVLKMRWPRYWTVFNKGKGRLHFKRNGPLRKAKLRTTVPAAPTTLRKIVMNLPSTLRMSAASITAGQAPSVPVVAPRTSIPLRPSPSPTSSIPKPPAPIMATTFVPTYPPPLKAMSTTSRASTPPPQRHIVTLPFGPRLQTIFNKRNASPKPHVATGVTSSLKRPASPHAGGDDPRQQKIIKLHIGQNIASRAQGILSTPPKPKFRVEPGDSASSSPAPPPFLTPHAITAGASPEHGSSSSTGSGIVKPRKPLPDFAVARKPLPDMLPVAATTKATTPPPAAPKRPLIKFKVKPPSTT